MKQVFRLSFGATITLVIILGASLLAQAQTVDPFVTQISASERDSFVGGTSGNGRFVVIESNGDIATDKVPSLDSAGNPNPNARNNEDGNREIFLFDYAQRRVFQITDTKSALRDTAVAPTNDSNVAIEVSNNRPVLSNNARWIVFSSNASNPASFNGNDAANRTALAADGNQELFIYFVPAPPAATLTDGSDVPFFQLAGGEFTQITNTAASRLPTGGTSTVSPFVADDNRDASTNDNASVVAFVSTRNLTGNNADGNPEVFIFRRTNVSPATGTLQQMTNTTGANVFNENPSVSGIAAGTSTVAFISSANISIGGTSNNADGNAEIYLGTTDATTAAVTRQVTATTLSAANNNAGANLLSLGRRLSRDGNLLAFESYADLSGNGAIQATTTIFIYNVAANTFTQVGPRAANTSAVRLPGFTDYNAAGQPSTIIFSSALNFTSTGTVPTTAADGLNPEGRPQIFSAPVAAPTTFTRLTNTPAFAAPIFGPPGIQTHTSDSRLRMAFSLSRTEIGGGNTDNSSEGFYLFAPTTSESGGTLLLFTGPSNRPVTGANPTAPAVAGLAPGMLAIIRSATALAPSAKLGCTGGDSNCASETLRRPALPVELNGVSVSINSGAAGLYSVSPGQINFVVPVGLVANTGTATYPIVVNNNGVVTRGTLQILPAQPDIFTTSMDAGGRAAVFSVTNNGTTETAEPFTVPATLRIVLSGVRNVTASQITVRIGTTDLTGAAILTNAVLRGASGFYQFDVAVPASLAGAGDVPVIVTVVKDGVTTSSRAADTAPRIQIN